MELFSNQVLSLAAVVLTASLVWSFVTKLYRARMLLIERKRQGLPVAPGHSFIFGHLLYLKSVLDTLPKEAHYQLGFATIAREHFSKHGAFYMDLWPMSGLFLTVVSPSIATDITQTNPRLTSERPYLLRRFLKPLTGGLTIFDLPESDWKPWRTTFTKGFSAENLYSLVPAMVEETAIFAEILRNLAVKGEMCFLDPLTLRFSIDVIGRTTLNTSLGSQRGYNTLADGMLQQVKWHQSNEEVNPFVHFNFVKRFFEWRNGRRMNEYIGEELDKRFAEYRADPGSKRTKAVIDLVIQAHMSTPEAQATERLDSAFRDFAIRQIRLFIFAGYDSTGSVLCYCLHLLSKHPKALSQIRAEHDEVFGKDRSAVFTKLKEKPILVNDLPYTLAVIKETLRLFPPAGTTRAGKRNVNIVDEQGLTCPTDDAMIWILHVELQRSPSYWVRHDDFLPERFLVEPGHELYPMKGAWRPFENGPRNCIGQALALIELRVMLSCLVRDFEVQPAYDEWDAAHPVKGPRTFRGERVFQIQEGASHPVSHYPCKIKLA